MRLYLQAVFIWILFIVSCSLTNLAVAHNQHMLTFLTILIFLIPILVLSEGFKTLFRKKENLQLTDTYMVSAMSRNTLLSALVYGWGSITLLTIYTFSGLSWLHGVQYGIGSGLIAILLSMYWYYTDWVRKELPFTRILAGVHGTLLATGLIYLISTGKLMTKRGDWAANYIFLTGGTTLLMICLVTFWLQNSSRLKILGRI